jgi:CubicO group peptidase (beta-lactamase class C family)
LDSLKKSMRPTLFWIAGCMLVLGLFSCDWKTQSYSHVMPYIPPPLSALDPWKKNKLANQVESYFQSTLLQSGNAFNGGILIAKGGHVLFEKYQGFEEINTRTTPLSANSSLHIASTSKTFTAIAILQLIQQGKIALTDSLERFFQHWPYPSITIKDLLNHRSGLPNYVYFMGSYWIDPQIAVTNKDVISTLIQKKPARNYPPNKRFEYCNTNYLLLASIIEKVTGLSYPLYMHKAIFSFLGMKGTFVYQPTDTNRITRSFDYRGVPWPFDQLDLTYGDKNIYSTPRDLLKWDQALYTQQLVADTLLNAAFTPYSFEKPGQNNYGLGFRLKLLPNQKKVVYHFGRWHGNNAVFARLMDEKVTVIILGNKFNRQIYSTASRSYGLFGPYNDQFLREEE